MSTVALIMMGTAFTSAKADHLVINTDTTACAFKVSFVSIGSGIDIKAKKDFNQWILKFNAANKVKITPIISRWGREGETDYCFKFGKLSKKTCNRFIAQTKAHLKYSKLVRYQ